MSVIIKMVSLSRTHSFFTSSLVLCSILLVLIGSTANASDQIFQDFFSDVCAGNPTGSLSARCTESAGGELSGDSESSLNTTQPLSSNDRPLAGARAKSLTVQKRVEGLRSEKGKESPQEGTLSFGSFSVFINGRGSWFDRDAGNAERGFDGNTHGLDIGLDYRFSSRAFLGGLLSYDKTDFDFKVEEPEGTPFTPPPNGGGKDADSYSFSLYGSYNITDDFYVSGNLGYGSTDYTFRRNAVFQESGRTIPQTNVETEADTDGEQYWFSTGLGYDFHRGALRFGPYGRTTFVRSEIDGYTEKDKTGSGLQMFISDNNRSSFTTDVGLKANYAISTGLGVLIPQAYFEWEHEFDKDPQIGTNSYVLDQDKNLFSSKGDEPDRDYFNVGGGLVLVLQRGWQAFVNYEVLIDYKDLDRDRVTGGIRKEL